MGTTANQSSEPGLCNSKCGRRRGRGGGATAKQSSEPGLCTVSVGEGGEGDERWMVGHRLGGS